MSDRESTDQATNSERRFQADSEDRLLAFADRLRHGREQEDADEEAPETWVAFRLMSRPYALPVTHVREFSKIGQVSRVPGAPPSVCGVASLRGHVIPIVDIKRQLGLTSEPSPDPDRVLVADHQGRKIGLIVDRVERVFKLFPSLIESDSTTSAASGSTGDPKRIQGFYKTDSETLVLLDPETFLSRADDSSA